MNPDEWARFSPEQQAWHWQQYRAAHPAPTLPPPPSAAASEKPGPNIAAIVSLCCGFLALLGDADHPRPGRGHRWLRWEAVAKRTRGPGARMSAGGTVLGLITTLMAFSRAGVIF